MWEKDSAGNWFQEMTPLNHIEKTSSTWEKDTRGNWFLREVSHARLASVV